VVDEYISTLMLLIVIESGQLSIETWISQLRCILVSIAIIIVMQQFYSHAHVIVVQRIRSRTALQPRR